jgi:hypothetical protein
MNDREQYDMVCKEEFKTIKDSLDKFYIAIFEGSETEPGIKTQIKLINQTISGILWLVSITVAATIVSLVNLWIK